MDNELFLIKIAEIIFGQHSMIGEILKLVKCDEITYIHKNHKICNY